MDEADNIHYQHDRGGKQAVTELVKSASQPVVLIANEYYDMSRGLRNATREIEFTDVAARSIVPVLRHICREEGVEYDSEALQAIAEANSGDLRSAVRDLQSSVQSGEPDRVTAESVTAGGRDRTVGVFPFLDTVLKEGTAEEAIRESYDVDETPDDLARWVEENVTKVYEGAELARAYEALSNADVWLGRVYQQDYDYSYWRYAGDQLAAGVAAARDGQKGGWTRYSRPQFWSSGDAATDEVVRKVAEAGGFSMATARRRVLPFLAAMSHHCKPRELTVEMAAYYDLDESMVAAVTGSGETTNKVESIVADAGERREAVMADHSGSAFVPGPDRESVEEGRPGDDGGESADDDGPQQATLAGDGDDGAEDDGGGGGAGGAPAGTADGDAPAGTEEGAAGDGGPVGDEGDEDDGQSGLSDFV
jgi:replication factor C large subunit